MIKDKKVESFIAVASFLAAVAFAFTALLIREDHNVTANHLLMVAQFLCLSASIFGLDYKLSQFIRRNGQKD